jgi:predicted HAD superfamily Cof-like phosphohydrolase
MEKCIKSVSEFHTAFGQTQFDTPTVNANEAELRHRLMKEENDEYLQAVEDGDLVEIADALGDQLYILCGTILKHGMQDIILKAFDLIHENNMSKLGPDGKPILREDGKILKPESYTPVDLTPLFNETRL